MFEILKAIPSMFNSNSKFKFYRVKFKSVIQKSKQGKGFEKGQPANNETKEAQFPRKAKVPTKSKR